MKIMLEDAHEIEDKGNRNFDKVAARETHVHRP